MRGHLFLFILLILLCGCVEDRPSQLSSEREHARVDQRVDSALKEDRSLQDQSLELVDQLQARLDQSVSRDATRVDSGSASDAGSAVDQLQELTADQGDDLEDRSRPTDAELIPEDPLAALFARPSEEELAGVRETWASWDVSAQDWEVLREGEFRGFQVSVIAHRVEGALHYGALRYPINYNPRENYPLLVLNHGGNNGVSVNIFGAYGGGCYRQAFILAASYRGEELRAGPLGLDPLLSEGVSSVIDRDVNDVIALLNGVLREVRGVDPNRIVAHGGSRGAGVTGLLAVRDPRISRAGVYYGATDHLHPDVRAAVQRALETGRGAGNPVNQTTMRTLQAYLDGQLSFAEARQTLIRSSLVYFADSLPSPYHHHHGTADRSVPIAQGRALAEAMVSIGREAPDFEYYEYEGGEHRPATLPGSQEAINTLLCAGLH